MAFPNGSLMNAFENNIYLKFPIPIKFPLSSVLVRKIERERGFDAVLELISCGKSDTQYFEKFEKLTGITRQTFDKAIKKEPDI